MVLIQLWVGIMMFHFTMKFLGFKPDKTKMYCGIAGYSGSIPPNMANIKILGMYNIARGDDSCGIALDNKCYKGIGINANWVNFIENNSIPDPVINNTVIVHTRKATGGSHTAENAHPFEFYRSDHSKSPYFIGCHNGTLKNETELETEFKIKDFKYNVDSQLLLKIISLTTPKNTANLRVLEKYKGGAALLFYWTNEPNTLYAWKGATKDYSVYNEERPLFYWKTDKGVYISSIKESLKAIGGDDATVFTFKQNTLFKIKEGEIEELPMKFERDFYVPSPSTTSITTPNFVHKVPIKPYKDFFKDYRAYSPYSPKDLGELSSQRNFLIDAEPRPTIAETEDSKVYFWRGRYWRNGHLLGNTVTDELKGIVVDLNSEGYPRYSDKAKLSDLFIPYYFYKGMMVRDKDALDRLIRLIRAGSVSFKEVSGTDITEVVLSSVLPAITTGELFVGLMWKPRDTTGTVKYYGSVAPKPFEIASFCNTEIRPLFSNITYSFNNGFFTGATKDPLVSTAIELPFTPTNKEVDVEEDNEIVNVSDEKELEELSEVAATIEKLNAMLNNTKNPQLKQINETLKTASKQIEDEFDNIAKTTALMTDSEALYANNI